MYKKNNDLESTIVHLGIILLGFIWVFLIALL